MIFVDPKDYPDNMIDGCYYINVTGGNDKNPQILRDGCMGHPLGKNPHYTSYLDWVMTLEDAIGHLLGENVVYKFDSEEELDDYLNKLRMAMELLK